MAVNPNRKKSRLRKSKAKLNGSLQKTSSKNGHSKALKINEEVPEHWIDGKDPLNPKQRAFVTEYLSNGFNGGKAALKTGYGVKSSVYTAASSLTRNPVIANEIKLALQEKHLTADVVLARLGEMATADMSQFVQEDGSLNKASYRKLGYLVKRFRKIEGEKVSSMEVELHDSQAALIHVGKHLGLFNAEKNGDLNFNGPVQFVVQMSPEDLP